MKFKANKNSIFRVYILGVALFVVLSVFGYYMADRSGLIRHAVPTVGHGFVSDMAYFDLPRITMSFGSSNATHLRVDIALEVARKDIPALEGYQPRITDKLNVFFSKVPLREIEDPAAMPFLRQEMLRQINGVTAPVPVHDLMLRQLVIM